ncbi:Tetratricopeptide repeat protein 39C [Choanephora cucurbitarum]|uniref:Tetratricopeptide repeat protein 39C n=1 Tax=Choanephora cucurbitarum TaxID=101091 RepID=A0A1C7N8N0_9FUNG|nr:Tetratricopeptide repeat protein 39C [Choanephora cucurbitarum]
MSDTKPTHTEVDSKVIDSPISGPAFNLAKETKLQEKRSSTSSDEAGMSSAEEETGSAKELGFVISALQDTLLQNQAKKDLNPREENVQQQPKYISEESKLPESEPKETVEKKEDDSIESKKENVNKNERAEVITSYDKFETDQVSQTSDNATIEASEIEPAPVEDTKETIVSESKEKEVQHHIEELNKVEMEKKHETQSDNDQSSEEESVSVPTSVTDVSSEEEEKQQEKEQKTFKDVVEDLSPPTPGIPPQSQPFDLAGRSSEDLGDVETYSANLIALNKIDLKNIKENTLSPRQQEKADEPILRAIRHLFNNRFMKAKRLFEKQAETDPLYALGLGSMAFLKAIMTTDDAMTKNAIEVLTATYSVANAQIDAATKKTVGNSVYQTMNNYYNYIKFARRSGGLPTSPKPATLKSIQKNGVTFLPNGVLRAHVAKAECCLQIAILQLLQETIMGYVKCGMNLRRAYTSYSLVWQEYKRMGQVYHDFIDRDTISGIQFGIGAVHLVLSSLPQKVLRIVSAFGWKADKHLGFALLKLCIDDRRIRSPMASLMLLAYYTTLTSLCPQILSNDYTQPAIETLLDAQKTYPNSAFFLYFAGKTSRIARNMPLSTQSFTYGIEISKNEWAEVEVLHMCSYEIAFNHMMEHNWEEAANIFDTLYKDRYWSPAIFRYLTGACLDMVGQRTEAILAFAEVPQLITKKTQNASLVERYVLRKVTAFQECGYQDMDMSLCAMEYLYLFTGFDFMSQEYLEKSLEIVDHALAQIVEAEKIEFSIRTRELVPGTPAPNYFDQRGALLLIKSSLYNVLGRFKESVIHLNWIMDHQNEITADRWVIPYTYWEAGVTSWGMNNKTRSRSFWETALKYNKYDFEYRMAMRVSLALTKADEIGVPKPEDPDPAKRHQTNKREPIIKLDSIEGRPPTHLDGVRVPADRFEPIAFRAI